MQYPDLELTQIRIISLFKSKYSAVMTRLSNTPKSVLSFYFYAGRGTFLILKPRDKPALGVILLTSVELTLGVDLAQGFCITKLRVHTTV